MCSVKTAAIDGPIRHVKARIKHAMLQIKNNAVPVFCTPNRSVTRAEAPPSRPDNVITIYTAAIIPAFIPERTNCSWFKNTVIV